jgi:4-hydroxy-3-polyprenylbenzoate decarboxylase
MVRVTEPVSMRLEAAAIQRRVFESQGPAIYFERPVNPDGECRFPVVSNLFGTRERMRYLFRDTLEPLKEILSAGVDPQAMFAAVFASKSRTGFPSFRKIFRLVTTAWHARPQIVRRAPVFQNQINLRDLPQLVSWQNDGGAYITLPQVYTEQPLRPGVWHSNLGMYRIQISGNQYNPDEEAGLHYQIHRGIANHHAEAIRHGQKLRVNVFIGGAPSMTVAAVMPLPEGMSELMIGGMLGGHRIKMAYPKRNSRGFGNFGDDRLRNRRNAKEIGDSWGNLSKPSLSSTPLTSFDRPLPVYADADFCISGYLDADDVLPEGPFGDHLGYYSLTHDFPVMKVENVWCRDGAVYPMTVVGRPPQEDSMFAELIHELTSDVVTKKVSGVKAVRAVDEAGVHPLLFVIGSERYTPYQPRERAAELLTTAHACLGFGQLSLAKFILLAAEEDSPSLNVNDTRRFLMHILERLDTERDLHFMTQTTCDTLDYTGGELNRGSKLAIATAGSPRRELTTDISGVRFPNGFSQPRVVLPGVLAVQAASEFSIRSFAGFYDASAPINRFPMIVIVDDSAFTAATLRHFLWTTFTRCDPAADVDGIDACHFQKRWGCRGSLLFDARKKPHHAPELVEDATVVQRIEPIVEKILGGS